MHCQLLAVQCINLAHFCQSQLRHMCIVYTVNQVASAISHRAEGCHDIALLWEFQALNDEVMPAPPRQARVEISSSSG
jgi:hypothetical protein